MIIEVKIPTPGESITEVEIANWAVADGDIVVRDQELAEIESDKATLQLLAPEGGKVQLIAPLNEPVQVGQVACKIDTSVAEASKETPPKTEEENKAQEENTEQKQKKQQQDEKSKIKITPVAKNLMSAYNLSVDDIINGLARISKKEVEQVNKLNDTQAPQVPEPEENATAAAASAREIKSERMSSLRRKLSQRLVKVKNETAMLTTFNEIDMSAVIALRKKYKEKFMEKHGIKLGFMSFFTKAVTESLKIYPHVGSMLDGDNLLTPSYCDIGIAVQAPKGLMVPVIRDAQNLDLAGIESKLLELAGKARNGKLTIDEMTGGTFTITNGGVFGSLLSTPILNPPQSAILGMHNIVQRPMAVNGKVEIRPMMYVALSYDHRVIDGGTSVGFLVSVKNFIENPIQMLFGKKTPEAHLLKL